MSIKPIIFSGPMVRALLEGRKTQTRRVLSISGHKAFSEFGPSNTPGYDWHFRDAEKRWHDLRDEEMKARLRFSPGDLLWVKETFWQTSRYPFTLPCGEASPQSMNWGSRRHYDADGQPENTPNRHYPQGLKGGAVSAPDPDAIWVKRPSIHMSRVASRLTLRVTDVRVQRLQDISEADARAEGIERLKSGRGYYDPTVSKGMVHAGVWHKKAVGALEALWNSIHGPDAWATNPWVCAVSFEVIDTNVSEVAA